MKEHLEEVLEEMAHRGLLEFDYGDHYGKYMTDKQFLQDLKQVQILYGILTVFIYLQVIQLCHRHLKTVIQ